VDCKVIYDAKHKVTHLCEALVVLNTIANAGTHEKKPLPGRFDVLTGGSPPPPSVLSKWKNRDSTSLIYTLSNTVNRKDSIGHIRSSCEELAFQLGNSNLYFVKS
jgi:hypothetical protein